MDENHLWHNRVLSTRFFSLEPYLNTHQDWPEKDGKPTGDPVLSESTHTHTTVTRITESHVIERRKQILI